MHAGVLVVSRVHGRVRRRGSAQTRGESVGGLRTTKGLTGESASRAEARGGGTKAGRAGSASHRRRAHGEACATIHWREAGISSHNGSAGARCTAAETADVLGKVVVVAALCATLPVTSAEGNVVAAATTTTHVAHSWTVTHVVTGRTHHAGVSTIAIAVHVGGCLHSWERATETGGTTLEVGEAARGTGPVTGTRAVLAGWESGEDVGGAIENARGGRRDLNGLFVEGAAVHAERLGSLAKGNRRGLAGVGG